MSESTTIHYFDGNRALPHEAKIELVSGTIHLFDAETNTGNALVFPLLRCKASVIGNRMFIYLEGGPGPYLEIGQSNESFQELKQALASPAKGWYEKLFRQKWPVLVGLLIGVVTIVYFLATELLPDVALKMITPRQEKVLGEKIYTAFIGAEKVDTISGQLAQQFANQLRLSDNYDLHITVVKDKEVNAFALPGGHIVLYSGILKVIRRPEELVALLGHEATHVNYRHSLRGMLSGISMSLLESLIVSGFGNVGDIVLHNANTLRRLGYSRKLEQEADLEGMQLMLKNQVDPHGMKELMEQLHQTHKDIPSSFSFISTHPLTSERIKKANEFIAQHKSATFAANEQLMHLWEQLKKRQ